MKRALGATLVRGAVAVTSSEGIATLDLSKGDAFRLVLSENVTSLRATNPKNGQSVALLTVQDPAVLRTVTPDGTTVTYKGGATAIPQAAGYNGVTATSFVTYNGVLYASSTVVGPAEPVILGG